MMGHSFGAATTVTALADDKRFKCDAMPHAHTRARTHTHTLPSMSLQGWSGP